jgi:hypothetical protein
MRETYDALMAGEPAHIVMNISTKQPVELLEFVGMFTSLANQYEKTLREQHPDLDADARIFVSEIRPGSIVAELIPHLGVIVNHMDQILIVEQFVKTYGQKLAMYFGVGGRDPDANKSDLKDFMSGVAAIASDPDGSAEMQAVSFEDGKRQIRASIQFRTPDARNAVREIEHHKEEMDAIDSVDYERVLMVFKRSDVGDANVGVRSGERVIIEEISDKDRALIYASQLAEQRIKDQTRNTEENIFHKGFVVDVNVRTRGGKPVAYAITDVHQIIDLEPDD